MRFFSLMFVCAGIWGGNLCFAQAASLKDVLEREQMLEAFDGKVGDQLAGRRIAYLGSLKRLETSFTRAGDFAGVKAVQAEIGRLSDLQNPLLSELQKDAPEGLSRLHAQVRKVLAQDQEKALRAQEAMRQQIIADYRAIQMRLVQAKRMKDAEKIQTRIDAVLSAPRAGLADAGKAQGKDVTDGDAEPTGTIELARELMFYYSFDQVLGVMIKDQGPKLQHLKIEGDKQLIPGPKGYAMAFTGESNLSLPSRSFGPAFTFAFWVRYDAMHKPSFIDILGYTGQDGAFVTKVRDSDRMMLSASADGTPLTPWSSAQKKGFPLGEWQHVIMVVDPLETASRVTWYRNGAADGQRTLYAKGAIREAKRDAGFIGTRPGKGQNEKFLGALDEVMMWDRALNAAEAKALFTFAGGGR